MARLNEAPVIGESVEALKRRFIRQNRELAKSNSTLNIRIANLEADRSQLLSDNITLREENNQLRQELERDLGRRALQNVGSVKEKLVTKVAELNELMVLLDKAHTERPKPTPAPKTTRRRSFQRSPTQQRNWRNTMCGPEVTGLAPIVEGKYFPRRTLDAEELKNTAADLGIITESPELGPPPVAHFEEGDPIKHDLGDKSPCAAPPNINKGQEGSDVPRDLGFANLETRRKRRVSSVIRATKDTEDRAPSKELEESNGLSSALGHPLRAGAKRKLSSRDEDVPNVQPKQSDLDGFAFNRRAGSATKPSHYQNSVAGALPEMASEQTSLDRKRDTVVLKPQRKALGEKSVNTDPIVSPVKPKAGGLLKAKDLDKNSAPPKLKVQEQTRKKVSAEKTSQRETSATKEIDAPAGPKELAPITPAPPQTDLFSPMDSQPSLRPDSRDTPPPADLGSQANEGGRPSRRQRAAVSYAEPSLRDKMRRPGKELVDAVATSAKASTHVTSNENSTKADSTMFIQKEDEPETAEWKKLPISKSHEPVEPPSPLSNKFSHPPPTELPSTVLTDRRRRSSIAQRGSEDMSAPSLPAAPSSTVSQSTIAALVAGSQERLSRARKAAEVQRRLSGEKTNLDIYEFNDSSPLKADPKDLVKEHVPSQGHVPGRLSNSSSRFSRRHSSMSEIKAGPKPREHAVGLARSNSAAGGLKADRGNEEKGEANGEIARNGTLGRAERAAARRRSMMV